MMETNPSVVLDELVREYALEHGVKYTEAMRAVLADPRHHDLKLAYAGSLGPVMPAPVAPVQLAEDGAKRVTYSGKTFTAEGIGQIVDARARKFMQPWRFPRFLGLRWIKN